uniref:Filamentous haemagglutinin family outer membrane protein n=1 Tax=Polynucleobacter necessarius subsp. necessarius (strain STIR1) TaxID=452638 RepID=B1XUG6_POLNS
MGTTATGTLHLTDTELGKLSNELSLITFGSASGTSKITAAEYTYVDNIKLVNAGTSSGGIKFIGAVSVGTNNLTLNTTGTVTAAITAAGLELLGTGGTYTLINADNAITTLAGNTGTVSFLENSGFAIGTINSAASLTTSGNTTLSSTGTVTQSAAITATGLELLGAAGIYTLTNISNAITTLAGNTGTVSLVENSGFAIGTVNTH